MRANHFNSSASPNFNVSEGLFVMEPLTSQQLERQGVNLGFPLPPNAVSPTARQPAAVRRGDPGHIKRPPNAFILFRSELAQRPDLSEALQRNQRNLNRIAGTVWRTMSVDDKAPWYARADDARKKHMQRYPNYQYHPDKSSARKKKERGEDMAKKYASEEALCRRIAHVLIHGTDSGSGSSISPTSPTPSMLSSCSTASPYLSDVAEDDASTQIPSPRVVDDPYLFHPSARVSSPAPPPPLPPSSSSQASLPWILGGMPAPAPSQDPRGYRAW